MLPRGQRIDAQDLQSGLANLSSKEVPVVENTLGKSHCANIAAQIVVAELALPRILHFLGQNCTSGWFDNNARTIQACKEFAFARILGATRVTTQTPAVLPLVTSQSFFKHTMNPFATRRFALRFLAVLLLLRTRLAPFIHINHIAYHSPFFGSATGWLASGCPSKAAQANRCRVWNRTLCGASKEQTGDIAQYDMVQFRSSKGPILGYPHTCGLEIVFFDG